MSRAKVTRPQPDATADVAAEQESPTPLAPAAAAQLGPPTTREVFAALRQNHVDHGPGFVRRQLAEAICGCALYSLGLDVVLDTVKLLKEMAHAAQQRGELTTAATATRH